MIAHNKPSLGTAEEIAALAVIKSGWVAQGPEVEAFERELCQFFEIPDGHALAVSSGSAALYLALLALNGKGKKIGLPAYACAALRNAVGLIGGQGVYLDCGVGSPNLDPSEVDDQMFDILIAPSIFGIPTHLPNRSNLKIIEDIAQSFGAVSSGKRIGLRGDIGICSFYATKIFTSGGHGGALISHDRSVIDWLRDYRQFDSRDDTNLRFNFQMTDVQAAIGRVQLSKVPDFLERREDIFCEYRASGADMLDSKDSSDIPARYRAVIKTPQANDMIQALHEIGVNSIVPVQDWELLTSPENCPRADKLSKMTVSLPIYPTMLDSDVGKITTLIRSFK